MKRAHCVIVRACSWLTGHTGALIIGLAVVWMASAPNPAWAQWTGGPTGPIYYNGGNVGIGTSTPVYPLHVAGSGRVSGSFTSGSWAPVGTWPTGIDYPGVLSVTGSLAGLVFFKRTLTAFGLNPGDWYQWYNQDGIARLWTPGLDIMGITSDGKVGIGIGTAAPQYKLAVNGTIGAKEVIVTNTGWPDYVFRPGYRLRPLSEVGAYIRAHHHLPDIPSAAEVKQKGVSLGDMQAKLLAKIEELTLHMIQQDKENRELRERIARLENRAAGR